MDWDSPTLDVQLHGVRIEDDSHNTPLCDRIHGSLNIDLLLWICRVLQFLFLCEEEKFVTCLTSKSLTSNSSLIILIGVEECKLRITIIKGLSSLS